MEHDSKYFYGLGVEQFDTGNFQEALVYFQKSIEIAPHFKTYERMYDCYKNLGNQRQARECIEKAFHLNSKNDKVAIEYILLLIEEDNLALASSFLEALLQRNPTYGPAKKLLDRINEVRN